MLFIRLRVLEKKLSFKFTSLIETGKNDMDSRENIFKTIYNEYNNSIYRFVFRLTGNGDETGDIVQEAFLRLYNHLISGTNLENPKAWIFRTAANICFDNFRRNGRYKRILEEELIFSNHEKSTEEKLVEKEEKDLIRDGLMKLPERDKVVLLLFQDGFSYKDMAQVLKVKKGSIGKILSRAIDKLYKYIKNGEKR